MQSVVLGVEPQMELTTTFKFKIVAIIL